MNEDDWLRGTPWQEKQASADPFAKWEALHKTRGLRNPLEPLDASYAPDRTEDEEYQANVSKVVQRASDDYFDQQIAQKTEAEVKRITNWSNLDSNPLTDIRAAYDRMAKEAVQWTKLTL